MAPQRDPLDNTETSQTGPRSQNDPVVSIIIPLHRWNEHSACSVSRCIELRQHASVEVIVISDQPIEKAPLGAKWLVTGATGDTSPALKRDLGASVARGTFLAYIDDDAYPDTHWIDRALAAIESLEVDGVGGPGVTPNGSNWRERLGGAVYCSILGSGPFRSRFTPLGAPRMMNELPAYNFIVKRDCIEKIGGWNSSFYGGEDTAVCTQLRLHGYKLGYSPATIVYHFRREMFRPHLRQVGNVGRHRGYFVRKRDPSSLRATFFVPSIIALCLPIAGVLTVIEGVAHPFVTLLVVGCIWIVVALTSVREAGFTGLALPIALAAHHLWYGVNFIRGLFTKSLDANRDIVALKTPLRSD